MRPYQDSRVRLVIDDGRHFLRSTPEQYDLVIFGTLDSQTLLSGQANLRLDNYIYTTECFEDARNALVPGGMLATYYSVFKP
jgi:spermidine synthase